MAKKRTKQKKKTKQELMEENNNLKGELFSQEGIVENLRKEVNTLNDIIDDVRNSAFEMEKENVRLSGELAGYRNKILELQGELYSSENKRSSAEEERTQIEGKFEGMRDALEIVVEKLASEIKS